MPIYKERAWPLDMVRVILLQERLVDVQRYLGTIFDDHFTLLEVVVKSSMHSWNTMQPGPQKLNRYGYVVVFSLGSQGLSRNMLQALVLKKHRF